MLQQEFWGNTLENWGISIIIIIVSILVMKLVSLFNKKIVSIITKKTKTKIDDILYAAIDKPILFAIILIGFWIAIHRLVYPDNFVTSVDSAYRILIVINITWFFARLVDSAIEVYWVEASIENGNSPAKTIPVIKRIFLVIVWIIGIMTALGNVGVNLSAVLGTLGIGGIAFALAAQDTVKNIFGAFTIFVDKPFNIGDVIQIDNSEGTVIDVGIRSTRIMNYDKRILTFPNYKVADALITNVSVETGRRVVVKLGLVYDTTPQKMNQAISILKSIPSKIEAISKEDVIANFTDFTDSALVITFIYFINKGEDIGGVTSKVNMEVLESFNNAGLVFAYPTQTLIVENGSIKPES